MRRFAPIAMTENTDRHRANQVIAIAEIRNKYSGGVIRRASKDSTARLADRRRSLRHDARIRRVRLLSIKASSKLLPKKLNIIGCARLILPPHETRWCRRIVLVHGVPLSSF